jgi:DNA invertase Pin-like site-specific DNA recombinase
MKVAVYCRVSTGEQSAEAQLKALRQYCAAQGWEVHREYVDVSPGAMATRPELDQLMADALKGRFKAVVVWKFDRFFRSVWHMLAALQQFRVLGIDFVSMTEAIDTSTPAGKMVFTMLAAVAELEKDLIRERTKLGMARARAAGKRIGRPQVQVDVPKLRRLRGKHTLRQIAKITSLSVGTVHKRLREPASPSKEKI